MSIVVILEKKKVCILHLTPVFLFLFSKKTNKLFCVSFFFFLFFYFFSSFFFFFFFFSFFFSDYTPSTCPPGTYYADQERCVACDVGKLRVLPGSQSIDDCVTCPKGYQYVNTTSDCTACIPGQYQEFDIIYSPKCKTCEKGKAAMNSQTICVDCPIGKFQDGIVSTKQWGCRFCDYGQEFVTSTEICISCDKGQIQPKNNFPSAKCYDCASGMYTIKKDSVACKYCKPGYEFQTIATTCSKCDDEMVQDDNQTAGAVCATCPSGYTFVKSNEKCSTCPVGKWMYKKERGVIESENDCQTCSYGKSSLHWRDSCTDCRKGLYQEDDVSTVWGCKHCSLGTEYNGTNYTCTDCDLGRYQNEQAGYSSSCKWCEQGTEFVTPYVICSECGNGTYQQWNDKAGVTCLSCPKGRDAPSNTKPWYV